MNYNSVRPYRWWLLAALVLGWMQVVRADVAGASTASGWTTELLDAVIEVGEKGAAASPKSQALVFLNNKAVNQMTLIGVIDNSTYQANQRLFEQINQQLVEKSATEAGLKAVTQAKKPGASTSYNPGTDTDIIVESTQAGKKIDLKQIEATEQAYQRNVREFLKQGQVEPPAGGKINTDTDFMPHPEHTTPEEFTNINRHINQNGGTAYERPGAATVEAQLRNPAKPPLDVAQTGEYVSEMQELASHKLRDAQALERKALEAAKAGNVNEAMSLRAEAQLKQSQAAKYIERVNSVSNKLKEQIGEAVAQGEAKGLDKALKNLSSQPRGVPTRVEAATVGALGEAGMNKAVLNYAETLAKLAKTNPEQAANAVRAIAEQSANLPPAQKGQLIQSLEQLHGKEFAQAVAKDMRAAAKGAMEGSATGAAEGGASGAASGWKSTVIKYLGPAMILYDGYGRIKETVKAGDADKPQVALEQGGQFIGGLGMAAIGAAYGSVIPGLGTVAGGIVGGLIGYVGGSWLGGHAGSKAAAYLGVKQNASDPLVTAAVNDLFDRLVKKGVPPEQAAKAALALANGSLAEFKKLMQEIRQKYGTSPTYIGAQHKQQDWYCTNRPQIDAPVQLPPIIRGGQ